MSFYLRKANALDKKRIYEWANDPDTRANSFNTNPIAWDNHVKWFEDSLSNENRDIFICMSFMKPVGVIRLDKENDKCVISYSVDKECRGQGLGKKELILVEKEALTKYGKGIVLVGEVKTSNQASIKAFKACGYESKLQDEEKIVFEKVIEECKKPSITKNRDASIELLRVIAMMMVIVLHYLSKGNLLDLASTSMQSAGIGLWIVEALCIVSVNAYVLISGYYLVNKDFKLSKLAVLVCQVFFYSVVIAIVAVLVGIVPLSEYTNLYNIQFLFLPVLSGHYWFATAYIIMYIFSPILAYAAKTMTRRQLALTIWLMLIPLSFANTILPYGMPHDDLGNSFVWFLCLFMIAAYIRMYGLKIIGNKVSSAFIYIFSAVAIIFARYCFIKIYTKVPSEHLLGLATNYNFVFVLTGALGLFGIFRNIKLKDNIISRFIVRIAPYTFGVYLLHEHVALRYEWPKWFNVQNHMGSFRALHLLLTVLAVFAVGIIVDAVRSLIFAIADKIIVWALKIYYKKQEVWDYLIFGVLSTVVNWIVYVGCAYGLLKPLFEGSNTTREMVANVIAWVVAVLFAYFTNRTFVFRSEVKGFGPVMKEFLEFVAARVLSFVAELILFFIMIDTLGMLDIVAKLLVGIVVIIMNYVFSKLWIFKSDDKKAVKGE